MAKDYNVHYNTISDINRCIRWNWLHNYKENIRYECQGGLKHGELSGSAKITEKLAKEIIEEIKTSNFSLAEIARRYNVKDSLIYDINRCRTWKYLHNYEKNIRREYRKESDAN